MNELIKTLRSKDATVGVIGLGYVGLPLAVLFAEAGFRVVGFESDPRKRAFLREGRSYIQDVPDAQLAIEEGDIPRNGSIVVPDDTGLLSACDAVIICVPTPLAKTRDPDLSYIVNATKLVRENLRRGQLIVLESTTYPGTTRELVLPLLTNRFVGGVQFDVEKPFVVGRDFFLAFSPERVDPGNRSFTTKNTPKVVGGITKQCAEVAQALYSEVVEKTVLVSSTDAAELTKLLENTFRLINIGLVNEFSIMCRHLGVDVWEVIDAAATKPFGFIPFYPGPGLGGHCIPVDPHYLSWKLRLHDYRARFIELASDINHNMPRVVVERVIEALNSRRKAVNGARIGILGVAYKRDIDDVRESPALDILTLLARRGADLSYHDPFIPRVMFHDGRELESSPLSPEWLAAQDCVVIVTDHSGVDMRLVYDCAPLVVDTRNALARLGPEAHVSEKVFKL